MQQPTVSLHPCQIFIKYVVNDRKPDDRVKQQSPEAEKQQNERVWWITLLQTWMFLQICIKHEIFTHVPPGSIEDPRKSNQFIIESK